MSVIYDEITLLKQERSAHASFTGRVVMTCGFNDVLGDVAPTVAILALCKIREVYVNSRSGADYLQRLRFNGTVFWAIDDGGLVTFLLPEEY